MNVNCPAGEVGIDLHQPKSSCTLNLSNDMGSIVVDGQNYSHADQVGNGTVRVDANVDLGSLTLNFE